MYVSLKDLYPGSTLRDAVISAAPGWSSFNPSISHSPEEGYRLIVRASNYIMCPDGLNYLMNDPGGVIRTINRLCVLDDDLNLVSMEAIDDSAVRHVEWGMVRGMEDARIYWTGKDWHVYGTLREHRWDGNCEIGEDVLEGWSSVSRVVHPNPEPGRPQKNWMILGEGPKFVYLCGPSGTIENGNVTWAPWAVRPECGEFRGGSQAIPYHLGGYVASVHTVTWDPKPRQYWHNYVRFDENGFLTHYTPSFYHMGHGIEFVAGMVQHGDSIVTSVGYKEHRVLFASVPIEELDRTWISAVA